MANLSSITYSNFTNSPIRQVETGLPTIRLFPRSDSKELTFFFLFVTREPFVKTHAAPLGSYMASLLLLLLGLS